MYARSQFRERLEVKPKFKSELLKNTIYHFRNFDGYLRTDAATLFIHY